MWPEKELEYVKLADDEVGRHYGLFLAEKLISVISLFKDGDGLQFRKFATLSEYQGQGYGSRLLQFVLIEAEDSGATFIWCNARKNKSSFYQRFGLLETEVSFSKGGREYIIMKRIFGDK